jgi:hypothetical protein
MSWSRISRAAMASEVSSGTQIGLGVIRLRAVASADFRHVWGVTLTTIRVCTNHEDNLEAAQPNTAI